jgi:hypothetical protein
LIITKPRKKDKRERERWKDRRNRVERKRERKKMVEWWMMKQ